MHTYVVAEAQHTSVCARRIKYFNFILSRKQIKSGVLSYDTQHAVLQCKKE